MQRRSLVASFRDAFTGIGHVVRTQRSARIQLLAAVLVVILAAVLHIPTRDFAILALAITMVLAAEMGNTVIETLADMVSPGPSEGARIAKDAAAGAVLMLAIGAVAVGVCILGPPFSDALLGRRF